MSTPSDPDPQLHDRNPHPAGSNPPVPAQQQGPTPAAWPIHPAGQAPRPRTNGLAIASMVLGIVWIYWIGSIVALVLGYVARKQIRERHEGGGGMAAAGITLGWVGVGVMVLLLVISFITYMSP